MRFITSLLIGLFFTASAIAQDGGNLTVWIQDEFQDGLMPTWTQISGTWTAEGGTVTARGGADRLAILHDSYVMPSKQAVLRTTVHVQGGGFVFNAEHPSSINNSQVVNILQGGVAMGYYDFMGNYIETRIVTVQDLKFPVTVTVYTDPVKNNYSVLLDDRNIALEELRFNSGYAGLYATSSGARFGAFSISGDGYPDQPRFFVKSNKRQLDNLSYMCAKEDGLVIVNPKLNIAQRITTVGTYVSEIQVTEENADLRGVTSDADGRTYIVDAGYNALRIFDNRDAIERIITEGLDDPRDVSVLGNRIYVLDKAGIVIFDAKTLASQGRKAAGLFRDPKSIAAAGGKLYVTDFGNGQVQVLNASDFSVDLVIKDDLVKPWGVTVDEKNGNIYVADPGAVAVFHFDKKGGFIERFDPITIRGFISPRAVLLRGDMLYVGDFDRILGFKKGVLTIRPTLRIN
jgi:hypothetical protein